MIAAAVPGGGVGGGERRVELGGVEVADDRGGGASAVTAGSPRCGSAGLRRRGVARPGPAVAEWLADTSYSELGITDITPILGLFRCPLLRARDGPVAWDDALW